MRTVSAMTTTASISVADLEVHADNLDPKRAAAIYLEHGALVVRGLTRRYVSAIAADIAAAAATALSLYDRAQRVHDGWLTPDGTLWIPAPKNFSRDKQLMVLGCRYTSSAAFFQSAFDAPTLDIVENILGPDVELFMDGQCLYKEPVGGHAKNLHQDAAYFEHRFEGPVAALNYAIDTDLVNGALHVIPGTHRLGMIKHVDTSSHLGLNEHDWPWERAIPIIGKAGDAIFFHVKTVHGSKSNRSSAARPVFIHRWRAADDYVVISASTTEHRTASESQVAEAKKENQMGFMVRGTRKFDAGRVTG
jgi:phytanoyl-CoA hydroxylase